MKLEVYCDGSAEERVGRPGGWAYVIVLADRVLASAQGAAPKTTSLMMELEGAIAALREVRTRGLHTAHEVVLHSDSRVVLEIAAGVFVPKPASYASSSRALRELALDVDARTTWVRAHAGHRWNEHVDELAHEARVALKSAIAARKRR